MKTDPKSSVSSSSQATTSDGARIALVAAVLVYAAATATLGRALDDTAIGLGLRLQARLSFVLFVAALGSRGLHAIFASRATAWLVRERSSLFLAFALSHLIHAMWIVLFYTLTPADFSWSATDISGVIAFPLIALLLVLQTAPGGRVFGSQRSRVETGIVAYVWVQFVGFFIDRLTAGRPELYPWYVAAIAISVAAAALAWHGRRAGLRRPSVWKGVATPRSEVPGL